MSDNRPWILATMPPFLDETRAMVDKVFRLVIWNDFLQNPDEYRHKIQGILYIPNKKPPMPEELLRSIPNLKVLATHSTGINHLDLPLLWKLGIKVGHARDILDDTCADFIFGLLIAAARRLPECIAEAQGHEGTEIGWDRSHVPFGVKISGATIGILGMGRIGYEVARRASGFKMKVLYYNRTQRNEAEETEVKATYYQRLEEMLPKLDYLVITCSLNKDSKNLLGKKQLDLMKPTAIIVNGARGLVIDEDALVDALRHNRLRGAALDATHPEPLAKDHPLLHLPNVIVTPHIASHVGETLENVMQNCIDNIIAGIDGRPLPTEVEPHP
ncbi:probable 2-ketogluconate reductase [Lytechinus pictus]|uniref:probable 2-ketogluconate reductase n=1 Tax=Lytechinus pictus TaxID=7653 RepID=UPI0030BA14A6